MNSSEVREYLRLVSEVEQIALSKASWDMKFQLIFCATHSQRLQQLLPLDYYDPDCSYQDDVVAYVNALQEQAKEIRAAFIGSSAHLLEELEKTLGSPDPNFYYAKVELTGEAMDRIVKVPYQEWLDAKTKDMRMSLVFRYGQNDTQPRDVRSVMPGDVIIFGSDRYRIEPLGFTHVGTMNKTGEQMQPRDRLTTKDLDLLREMVRRDDACQDDTFALIDELIEARRIGQAMCDHAHNLTTIIGNGEYGVIYEARRRLTGKP